MRRATRLEAIWIEVPAGDAEEARRPAAVPAPNPAAPEAGAVPPATPLRGQVARDVDAAIAAARRRALVWRALRAIASFVQPPSGKYLCAGPAHPSPRATDAFLVALVRERGAISWTGAAVALGNRLLLDDGGLADACDRPSAGSPWLWRAVANQLIADAVDRSLLVVAAGRPCGRLWSVPGGRGERPTEERSLQDV